MTPTFAGGKAPAQVDAPSYEPDTFVIAGLILSGAY